MILLAVGYGELIHNAGVDADEQVLHPRESFAISTASVSLPSIFKKAYAVTTSMDAEDERPAPFGISPW